MAAGARVVPIPGPSAVLAALVGAGLPTDRFLFLGFPPRKSGARRRLFESVRALPFTLVFYESPLRAGATLADLAAVLGADAPRLPGARADQALRGAGARHAGRARRPLRERPPARRGHAGRRGRRPTDAAAEELEMTDEIPARAAELSPRPLDPRRRRPPGRPHRPPPPRGLPPDPRT